MRLAPAGAFDPEGDGRERDEEAGLAVDGRADTAWRTEHYSSFFKDGVGLVLDAGRTVRVEQVVVDTPTPGYRAEIRLGASRDGPFVVASPARTVTARTRFPVARRTGRYVVVWVVELPPDSAGEVAEVRVRARCIVRSGLIRSGSDTLAGWSPHAPSPAPSRRARQPCSRSSGSAARARATS